MPADTVRRSGPPPSSCRSCGAAIVWATMASSGKFMPLERDDANGTFVILKGVASHQGPAPAHQPPENTIPRYVSHFARCRHAEQWRGRK